MKYYLLELYKDYDLTDFSVNDTIALSGLIGHGHFNFVTDQAFPIEHRCQFLDGHSVKRIALQILEGTLKDVRDAICKGRTWSPNRQGAATRE